MTDYRYLYSRRMKRNSCWSGVIAFVSLIVLMGVVGAVEHRQPVSDAASPPPVKSATQSQIETILPEPVAAAIVRQAPEYPKTLACIAYHESRGDHRAVGDGGKSKGLFQVQEKWWAQQYGPVPDDIEGQVAQSTRMFLDLKQRFGYRRAVAMWNPNDPDYVSSILDRVKDLK